MSDSIYLGSAVIPVASALAFCPLIIALLLGRTVPKGITIVLLGCALGLALTVSLISYAGLAGLLAISGIFYMAPYWRKEWQKTLSFVLLFISSAILLLHLLPGVHNPLILDQIFISPDALPFTKYLNFDKGFLGALFLGFVLAAPKFTLKYWFNKQAIIFYLLFSLIAFSIALTSGLVILDLKWPDTLLFWALTNLLFTCVAEEAVFRGLIQETLHKRLAPYVWGNHSAVLISGLLFGLVHFPAGLTYMLIASLMGVSYAYGYARSRNIYVPILMHFVFNLAHFLCFSYPFLAQP